MGNDWSYNEKELIAQVAEGDERAFSAIVDRYAAPVFAHVLTYLKDVGKAEELTQDIFLSIWKTRATLIQLDSFRAYLFVTARNKTISALRQKIKKNILPAHDEWEDTLANPQQTLEYRELNDSILQGIELLPPRRKQVFKLSRLEGLSYEAIAQQLNISKSAVNQHIVEALVFLRTYLHDKTPLLSLLLAVLAVELY